MNKVFKVIFNKSTCTFTAVSELAKGRKKTKSEKAANVAIAAGLGLAAGMGLMMESAQAATFINDGVISRETPTTNPNRLRYQGVVSISEASDSTNDAGNNVVIGSKNGVNALNGSISRTVVIGNSISGGGSTTSPSSQNVLMGSVINAGSSTQAVAIGNNINVNGTGAIAIGSDDAGTATELGTIAGVNFLNTAGQAGGFGSSVYRSVNATGRGAVGIGAMALATGDGATAVGMGSTSNTEGATSFGTLAFATGERSSSFGLAARAGATDSLALGANANASFASSVAIGSGSVTTQGVAVTSQGQRYNINGQTYDPTTRVTYDTSHVVSVGNATVKRQIQNVAPGQITATSTDAINGSQLYDIAKGLQDRIGDSGFNLKENGTQRDKITNNETLNIKNGTYTTGSAAANGDVTFNVVTQNIANANGIPSTSGTTAGVTTATTVVNAIKDSGFNLQANGANNSLINPGDTINMVQGSDITVSKSTSGTTDTVTIALSADTKKLITDTNTTATTNAQNIAKGINFGNTTGSTNKVDLGGTILVEGTTNQIISTKTNNGVQLSLSTQVTNNLTKASTAVQNVTGTDGVTANKTGDTVTVGLDAPTKAKLDKADTALQSITVKSSANGNAAQTINNDGTLNFTNGDNIVLTPSTTGIAIATAKEVNFDQVTVGTAVINKDTGINAGNKAINGVLAATANGQAVNFEQLKANTTTITAGANITSVNEQKTANGITYRIDAKDTSATVSSKTPNLITVGNNGTTAGVTDFAIDLSTETKANLTKASTSVQGATGENGVTARKDGDNIVVGLAADTTTNIQKGVDAKTKVDTEGLTFTGNTGTSDVRKLGESLAIEGKDGNIITTASGTKVEVALSRNLNIDTLTTTGTATFNGKVTANGGVDMANQKITNLQAGTANGDAVNFGQLNDNVTALGNRITTNAGNIATNTQGIADNKQAIANNAQNITANTNKINEGINFGNATGSVNNHKLGGTMLVEGTTDQITSTLTASGVQLSLTDKVTANLTKASTSVQGATGENGVTARKDGDNIVVGLAPDTTTNIQKGVDAKAAVDKGFNVTSDSGVLIARALGDTVAITGGNGTGSFSATNVKTVNTANGVQVQFSETPTFTSVTTGTNVLNADGLTVGGASITNANGINAGNKAISGVATGGDVGTNAANIDDVKRLAKAADTSASVSKGSEAVVVNNNGTTNGVTDYTVDLSATSKASLTKADSAVQNVTGNNGVTATKGADNVVTVGLAPETEARLVKADSAVQEIKTKVNGTEVKTLKQADNEQEFIDGDNIDITAESGKIKVATAKDVTFTNVNTGTLSTTGATTLGGTLAVTGASTFTGGSTFNGGVTVASGGFSVATGNTINMGNNVITGVASGGNTDTNAANIADVKRLAQAGDTSATVSSANEKALKVTPGTPNNRGVTDFALELGEDTVASLAKADSALQNISIKTAANSQDAQTIANNGTFNFTSAATNSNIELTPSATGIAIATARSVNFDNATVGGVTINGTTNKITGVEAGTSEKDAVNFGQLNDNVTALGNRITTNAGNIATNTQGIADNQQAIANNAQNITANTNKINEGINFGNSTTSTQKYELGGKIVVEGTDSQINSALTDTGVKLSLSNEVNANLTKASTSVQGATGEKGVDARKDGDNIVVGLSANTENRLVKADTAVQEIKTTINGGTAVKTLNQGDNTQDFQQGDNIVISQENGSIKVATANEVSFDKTTVGNVVIDKTTNKITGIEAGTSEKDAVNFKQLNDNVTAINNNIDAAKTELTNKGLDFSGNTGNTHRNLGTTLNISGLATTVGDYNGKNVKTVVTETGVAIQIAENPEFTSVKTGTNVLNADGLTVGGASITNANGINAGNKQITGVSSGATGKDGEKNLYATDTNAANIGDVKDIVAQNAEWKIQNNTAAAQKVGGDKNTVNFINGTQTTATVSPTNDGYSVQVNVSTTDIEKKDGEFKAKDNGTGLVTASNVASTVNTAVSDLITKGFNVSADSGNEVHRNLGETVAITGGNGTGEYSTTNVRTVTTTNGVQIQLADNPTFKAVQADSLTTSGNINTGGALTVTGASTFNGGATINNGATVNGGLTVNNGGLTIANGQTVNMGNNVVSGVENGVADKDAVNISQLRENVTTINNKIDNAANNLTDTLTNKGLNFTGNDGNTHRNLGTTLNVSGLAATTGNYSGNNVKTVVTESGVAIQIAENPEFTSVKTGTNVLNGTGLTVGDVSITNANGINAGNKTITNVAAGKVAQDSNEAINGSQLYNSANAIKTLVGGNAVNSDGNVTASNIGNSGKNTIHEAVMASREEVESSDGSVITEVRQGDNAQAIYDVKVAQSTFTTAADKKSVTANQAGNAFATAENVATAINTAAAAATTEVTSDNGSVNIAESRGENGQNIYDLEVTESKLSYTDGKVSADKAGSAFATGENVAQMINVAKVEVRTDKQAELAVSTNEAGQTVYTVSATKTTMESTSPNALTINGKESDDGIIHYTAEVNTHDLSVDTNGKVNEVAEEHKGKLATVENIVNTINQSGFNVIGSGNKEADAKDFENELIKPSDTVTLEAGKNLTLAQEGGKFTFATANNVAFETATFRDPVTGNTVRVNGNAISLTAKDNTDPSKVVSLTTEGLNNGGNQIKNVAAGTEAMDAVNVSQLKTATAASQEDVVSNDGSLSVQRDVNPVTKATTFDVSVNVDGKTITKDNNGQLTANTTELTTTQGKVNDPVTLGEPQGHALVTAETVVKAINESGFNAKSGGNKAAGDQADAELIKAGDEVEFNAGKNLNVKRVGKTFTYETQENVEFTSVKTGTNVLNGTGLTVGDVSITNANGINAGNKTITNVAVGKVAQDSKEAINGSQLYNSANAIKTLVGGNAVNSDGNVTASNIGNSGKNTIHEAVMASREEVESSDGSVITEVRQGDNAQAIYDVKVAQSTFTTAADKKSVTANQAGNAFATAENVATAINTAAAAATTEVTSDNGSVNIAESRGENGQNIYDLEVTESKLSYTDGKVSADKAGSAFATGENVAEMINNASAMAKTEVKSAGFASVTEEKGVNGQTVYTVNVAKAEASTADKGKVAVNPLDEDKVMSAGDVINAINHSGFTLTTGQQESGLTASPDTKELINPGKEVKMIAGDNLVVAQEGGNIAYSLRPNINIESVQFNNGPKITNDGNNITVSQADGSATKITNVADGDVNADSKDAVNGSQLHTAITNINNNITESTQTYFHTNNGTNIGGDATTNLGGVNQSAGATAVGSLAAGIRAKATGENGVAVGSDSLSSLSSVAVGNKSKAEGRESVAIGLASSSSAWRTTAIGYQAEATVESANALGNQAKATNWGATAVGTIANASGINSSALGNNASSSGSLSLAVGTSANATGSYATAVGTLSNAKAYGAIGTGLHSYASGQNAIATGSYSVADGIASIATGWEAVATGRLTTAIGYNAKADNNQAIAVGTNSVSPSSYAVSIGSNTGGLAHGAVALGRDAIAGGDAELKQKATAYFEKLDAYTAKERILATTSPTASSYNRHKTEAEALKAELDVLKTEYDKAVQDAFTKGEYATALGAYAQAEHKDSVALGSYSTTAEAVSTNNATVNGISYSGFAGNVATATVSVGKEGTYRTITNMAAGRISATSTDAINGSQLYAVVNAIPATYTTTAGAPLVKVGDKFYKPTDIPADGSAPDENKAVNPADVMVSLISPNASQTANAATTLANVKSNLAPVTPIDEKQPDANSLTNLADKLNNAASVADVLNAGWNLQNNDTAIDTVTHNDAVNFINGRGTTVSVMANDDGTVNNIQVDSALGYVNTDVNDTSTPNSTVKVFGKDNSPVQITNVASGVRKADGTAPVGQELAEAIKNATGDTLNNAVNVGDLKAAVNASKTEVVSYDESIKVTEEVGENGQTIYDLAVSVDDTTIETDGDGKLRVKTTELKPETNAENNPTGKVAEPSTEDAPKLVNAGDIAKAINASGFNVKSGGNKADGDDETSTLINPGKEVTFTAGDNLKVKRVGNEFSFETAKDVAFDKVTVGPVTLNKDSGIDAGNTNITNVKSNLAPVTPIDEKQPDANSLTNLADKLNNAATVADVLNAGWNLQNNDTAIDTVTHNDAVNFINGRGTTISVTANDDGTVNNIQVDSALGYVNTDANDTSTPSNTIKVFGKDNSPVQMTNVASGVRKADGTAPVGQELAEAIKNATGDTLNNAVNVGDLKATVNTAIAASQEDVVSSDGSISVQRDVNPVTKATTFDVSVNVDNTTITKDKDGQLTANTVNLTNDENGKVNAPTVGGQDAGKSLVTAQTVVDAINNSGFTLTTGQQESGLTSSPDTKELINPGKEVKMIAGDNLVVAQEGGNIAYSLRPNINIESVQFNNGPKITNDGNNITVSQADGSATKITNVAAGEDDNDAVNVSQLNQKAAAAKTEVESVDSSVNIEEHQGDNGQTIYDLSVNQSELKASDDKKTVSATKAGNAFATAEEVANAINTAAAAATTEVTSENGSITVTESRGDNGQNIYDLEVTKSTLSYDDNGKVVSNKDGDAFATGKNVADMINTAAATAKTEVTGTGFAVVTPKNGENGQTIYNVDVAKADAPTVTNGKVATKAGDEDKVMRAGDVVNAINASGFKAKANGDDGELINPGDEVNFKDGDNIKVTRNGSDFTIATAKDVKFDSVQLGDNGPKLTNDGNNIKLGDKDGNATSITNLKSNLAPVTPVDEKQPDANNPANLADKLNNAATVADVLNAGWNLQNNDTAVDTVTHNDTVNFVDGRGTTVSVTANDDGTANNIQVDVETDDKTITVKDGNLAAVTTTLADINNDGKIDAPTNGDSLVNATTVANAINNSGFMATASGNAVGTKKQLIKAGETVTLDAGKNLTVTQTDGKFSFATKDDVNFNSVQFGDISPKITNDGSNIKVSDKDGNATKITNVANGTAPTDAVNFSQLQASREVVKSDDKSVTVTTTQNAAGANVFDVSVNVDGTTITKDPTTGAIKANTANLNVVNDGNIDVPTNGDENKLITAGEVAQTVNNVSWAVDSAKDETTANEATKNTYTAGNNKVKAGDTVKVNAGRNVEISGSGKNINVAVSDNPEFNTVKVGKGKNATTISSDADGVRIAKADGSPQRITNVAAGRADNDAVNVGQLKGAVGDLNKKINRNQREARAGIAGAAAIAGLPEIHLAGKSMVATAASTYKGENAIAVGYSRLSDNSKIKLKITGSADTKGDFIGTVGVGYAW